MKEPVLPPDYPVLYARESIRRGLKMEGHLLTAGEVIILRRWQALSNDAAHTHARLCSRERHPVRVDGFRPPLKGSLDASLDELEAAGLVDFNPMIPWNEQLCAHKVSELRALCKTLELTQRGRKDELVHRLSTVLAAQPKCVPLVRVRHRKLFRRIHRTYLHDHDGDLSRVVLSEIGVQSRVEYTTTSGSGRFRNRRELRDYETELEAFRKPLTESDLKPTAERALTSLRNPNIPSDFRWRFSAHRFLERNLIRATRELERLDHHEQAANIYREALQLPLRNKTHIAHRLALCLGRADLHKEGAQACLDYEQEGSDGYRLIRTGQRLARKAGIAWSGRTLPKKPTSCVVQLPYVRNGTRWETEHGPMNIESAVIAHLQRHGRTAFHGENGLWTTLFGLLFSEALFTPVPEMLPSPYLRAPLDFGSPQFRERRKSVTDKILHRIERGQSAEVLAEAIQHRDGQQISGVSWSHYTPHLLREVLKQIPVSALLFIMEQFLAEGRSVGRGLPDLVVLAKTNPSPPNETVPQELFLVEVKGPSDSLRDHQHWWIDKLLANGVNTQLWQVCPVVG